jgi:predicted RNA methylase
MSQARQLSLADVDRPRDFALSQWFTHPDVAAAIVRWAGIGEGDIVLEPAAGTGALVRAATNAGAEVEAWEIDPRYEADLHAAGAVVVQIENFLRAMPAQPGFFDYVLANTPYEDGRDVDFVLHGLKFAPTYIGIFRSALVHGEERYESLWRWVDIVRGKWLVKRPSFGVGASNSNTARSDFCALELRARKRARKLDEDMNLRFGWLR